jgi:hypothetical protein
MRARLALVVVAASPLRLRAEAGDGGACAACRTHAAASLLSLPPAVCTSGHRTEAHVVVRARARDGRAVRAGGDLLGVALGRGAEELYPLAVVDRCDGTYAALIPCYALPPGDYALSARLEHAHARDAHAPSLWFCGSRARGFTAWDAHNYSALGALYECARGAPVGASGPRRVRVGASRAAAAAPAAAEGGGGARCWADEASRAFLTARDGREALPAPVLAACALPDRAERALRFERGPSTSFHHCLQLGGAGGGCARIEYDARVPACVDGQRLALVGDSVTEGTFADLAHMWGGAQRDGGGRPIDKRRRDVCKWRSRLRRMVPVREPPTALRLGGGPGEPRLNATLLNLKVPYRSGPRAARTRARARAASAHRGARRAPPPAQEGPGQFPEQRARAAAADRHARHRHPRVGAPRLCAAL